MGFWSMFQGVLWIICIIAVGILAVTVVCCCLGPVVYVGIIVVSYMFKIVFWFWDHTIPYNSNTREVSSRRRAPEPPPPPVWIDKEASDE